MHKKFATDIDTLMKEVKINYYRSTGPGGRKKDTAETAVRLRHIPSGITVIATEYRFQARNRKLAFERLQKKLIELNKEKKPRIPTKKSLAAESKILEEKKKRAWKKKLREKVEFEEDMG